MQKLLIPATLAIALSASGMAFADQAEKEYDYSLYEETSAFAIDDAFENDALPYWRSVNLQAQQASVAPLPGPVWSNTANAIPEDLYDHD